MSKKQIADSAPKKNARALPINEPWYIKYSTLIFSAVLLIIYSRCLSLGYTYLDDSIFILDKGFENEKLSSIFNSFFQGTFGVKDIYYRPLFRISFIIERQILFLFPKETFVDNAIRLAHFFEIILHLINVSLLYKLLQKFSFSKINAFLWCLVFAVHPVLTMAVAWIPGRNDLMLSIFIISFFLHFIQYLETKKKSHLIWQFIFLMLALLTKESGIFIPFAAILYLIIFYRQQFFAKSMYLIYCIWMAELACWFFLRQHVLDTKQLNQQLQETIATAIERIPGLLQYTGKIFLPFNLTVYPTIADTTYWFGIISVAIITVLIILNKNRNLKMIVFGFSWFVLFIFPFFLVPKHINDALYEHRLYVPIFGMLLITREATPILIQWLNKISTFLLIGILILFSIMTMQYMSYFNDEINFYTKAAKDSPSSAYATKMLGIRLIYKDREAEALPLFIKAFKLDSTQNYTRYFLAKHIYIKQDSLEKAKKLLLAEINLTPTYTENYFQLAYIAYRQNDFPTIIKYLKKVLELQPGDKVVCNNLMRAYIDSKNKPEAKKLIEYMQSYSISIDNTTMNSVNQLPD